MTKPLPYAQRKPLLIEEVDLDPPGEGELLVRVKAAGLCHSDLSSINGDPPRQMPPWCKGTSEQVRMAAHCSAHAA